MVMAGPVVDYGTEQEDRYPGFGNSIEGVVAVRRGTAGLTDNRLTIGCSTTSNPKEKIHRSNTASESGERSLRWLVMFEKRAFAAPRLNWRCSE
jgi:hypothetical protein